MIVDDEPYNVLGLTIVLQQSGYSNIQSVVDTAYTGQQALDLVVSAFKEGKESYGLIFMDCSMPIMDGYTASEKIRKFIKKLGVEQPMIVACTGHTEEEYIKKAFMHQIDEVIPKPTNVIIVKEILRELIIIN